MRNHAGCAYCGGRNKGNTPLKSIVVVTVEADGKKNHGHTMGQALCDGHATGYDRNGPTPILDLRVPMEQRRIQLQ